MPAVIQNKVTGLFTKRHGTTPDIQKARVFTHKGHAKNSVGPNNYHRYLVIEVDLVTTSVEDMDSG